MRIKQKFSQGWNENMLRIQFASMLSLGYLSRLEKVSAKFGQPVNDYIAIGSRETNWNKKYETQPGDRGNGFTIFQIDKRYFPAFIASGKWRDKQIAANMCGEVLQAKMNEIRRNHGTRSRVKSSSTGKIYYYTGADFEGPCGHIHDADRDLFEGDFPSEFEHIAFAAYNSGMWSYYHHSKGRSPDYGTTGKDYGLDVMYRSMVFRHILIEQFPEMFGLDKETEEEIPEHPEDQEIEEIVAAPTTETSSEEPKLKEAFSPHAAVQSQTVEVVSKPRYWTHAKTLANKLWLWILGLGITGIQVIDKLTLWFKDHPYETVGITLGLVALAAVLIWRDTYLDGKQIQADKDLKLKEMDLKADPEKISVKIDERLRSEHGNQRKNGG